jgi:hypothetical protein
MPRERFNVPGRSRRVISTMTNVEAVVAECNQKIFIDPDEERHNELMTEANWALLKRMPNSKPRLVVDNTVGALVAIPKGVQIATDFITGLFSEATESPIHFCSFGNERNGEHKPKSINTCNPDEMASFMQKFDVPGRGMFFGVGTLKDGTFSIEVARDGSMKPGFGALAPIAAGFLRWNAIVQARRIGSGS